MGVLTSSRSREPLKAETACSASTVAGSVDAFPTQQVDEETTDW